jgi:hypothetical protein
MHVIARRTTKLAWTRGLIALLFDELQTDDLFTELVGHPRTLPARRYPHAVAVALALRHSWQRDDLFRVAKRLGIPITVKALATDTSSEPSSPSRTRESASDEATT